MYRRYGSACKIARIVTRREVRVTIRCTCLNVMRHRQKGMPRRDEYVSRESKNLRANHRLSRGWVTIPFFLFLVARKTHKSRYGHSENARGPIRADFSLYPAELFLVHVWYVQPTYTDHGSEAGTKRASVWMLIWIMYRTGSRHQGTGEGEEGRKRKLELDTHRIMKAAIYGRARSTGGEGRARERRERERESVVKERDEKLIFHGV